jgi:hypothetical protein
VDGLEHGGYDEEHCVRCGLPVIFEGSMCARCNGLTRAEVEVGLYELRLYLDRWAAFRAWEEARASDLTPHG